MGQSFSEFDDCFQCPVLLKGNSPFIYKGAYYLTAALLQSIPFIHASSYRLSSYSPASPHSPIHYEYDDDHTNQSSCLCDASQSQILYSLGADRGGNSCHPN